MADLPKENKQRKRIVVITHGAESTIVVSEGKVTEYSIIPITKEKIVDTNGAGDAFVGGFLSQLVKGKPVEKCVDAGHFLANLVIQRSGATFPETACNYA